jgi:predicted HAD superfamily hydrolase
MQASMAKELIINEVPRFQDQYWEKFGFQYGGMVLYNFVQYIYNYCQQNKIEHIYFMARDGEIIKKVFDLLYNDPQEKIQTHYMFASRRLFWGPSITELDDTILNMLCKGDHGTCYIDIIEKLAFNWLTKEAKIYFDNIYQPIRSSSDRENIKHFLKQHRQKILQELQNEHHQLIHYLDTIGFLKNHKKLIVDVGWNCTSQKYLESIVHQKINALYYGTLKTAYRHENIHGYFFHNGIPVSHEYLVYTSQNVTVFELLFIGTHHSIVRIDQSQPVLKTEAEEETKRIALAQSVQKGTLAFVKQYHELLTGNHLDADHSLNEIFLTSLLVYPTITDIQHIAQVPHVAGMGESIYHPIIRELPDSQFTVFKNIFVGKAKNNKSLWPLGKQRYMDLMKQTYYKPINTFSNIVNKVLTCSSYGVWQCLQLIYERIPKWKR